MRMDDTKKITRNLSFIKKTITEIDSVIDILIEEEILGMSERNVILTEEDPIHSVLEIVLKKQAYKKFVKALRDTGNERIVDRLNKTETSFDKDSSKCTCSEQDTYTDDDYKNEKAIMLQRQLENLIKENQNLKEQQSRIRRDLNQKQQRLLELNKEACSFQKQNTELTNRLGALRKSDLIQSTIDDMENSLSRKEEQSKQIKNELKEKTEEVEYLRNLLEQLRIEVDEKTDQIAMLSREMKCLKEEHLAAKSERRELKLKVENIHQNFDDKLQTMMNVITGAKNTKTVRQMTYVRTTPRPRNQSRDRTQNKDHSSLPSISVKTPVSLDSKSVKLNVDGLGTPRSKPTRQAQQILSPGFVFSTKRPTDNKPTPKWK